jgi:hypothetical protein
MPNERDTLPRVSDERLDDLAEDRTGWTLDFGIWGKSSREVLPMTAIETLSLIDEVRRARAWAREIKSKEGAG